MIKTIHSWQTQFMPVCRRIINKENGIFAITTIALGALNLACIWHRSYPWTLGVYLGFTLLKDVIQDKLHRTSWKVILATSTVVYFTKNTAALTALEFLVGTHLGSTLSLESPPKEPSTSSSNMPKWLTVKTLVAMTALGAFNALCIRHRAGPWGAGLVLGSLLIPEFVRTHLTERISSFSLKKLSFFSAIVGGVQIYGALLAMQFLVGAHLGSEISLRWKEANADSAKPDCGMSQKLSASASC